MTGLFRVWNTFHDRLPAQAARLLGVVFMVLALYTVLLLSNANARSLDTQQTIAEQLGYFGLSTLGVGILIVCGGIDLSIGSVVGLGAVCFGLMLESPVSTWEVRILSFLGGFDLGMIVYLLLSKRRVDRWLACLIALFLAVVAAFGLEWMGTAYFLGQRFSPWTAALVVLWGCLHIGLAHGLLVTKLRLQPFLVTLCGLFIYRGLAKWLAPDHSPGWHVEGSEALRTQIRSFRDLFVGNLYGVPNQLILMLIVAVVLGLFLHGTRYGRYLFAIGANEDAARYAGIPTDRYKVLAYVICSMLAGLSSLVFLFYFDSVQPTSGGSWLELYAITGAVLGGCSLRGGEGSVPGLVLGAAVLPLLQQVCYSFNIKSELEYAVIGAALLLGTITDELLKRRGARRG
jgi:ribose transport system permease protein